MGGLNGLLWSDGIVGCADLLPKGSSINLKLEFFIFEMTLGELLYGSQCSDHPAENIRAVRVFCQYVTIVPTHNIWDEFAIQKSLLRRKGKLIEDAISL